MRSSYAVCTVWVFLAVGCGRLGYGQDGESTRVSLDGFVVKDDAYAVTGTDEGFAVTWAEFAPATVDYQVAFARTDHDGNLLQMPEVIVGPELNPAVTYIEAHQRPDLGVDVLFIKGGEVCLARLDSRGAVIMLYEWMLPSSVSVVSFVPVPDGYAMLYQRRVSGTYKVFVQRLSATAELVGAEIPLETTTSAQYRARGVFDGARLLVVWQDAGGDDRIRYARVDLDGTVAVPPRDLHGAGSPQSLPQLAWTGERAVVAFAQEGMIKTVTLDDDETVWASPVDTLREPRRESTDYTIAARPDAAVMVSEYDWLSSATQAAFSSFDPRDPDTVPTEPEELSDAAWSHTVPKVAAGAESFGVVYRGDVEGSRRLMLSVVRP